MLRTAKSLRRACAGVLGVVGCFGATLAVAQSQPADGNADLRAKTVTLREGDVKSGLETVVVTARRREESLQDVPVSIVAVSGEDLERRSIQTLESLGQNVPNVTFAEVPQSGRMGGSVFIRGIGQRDPISPYDPAIGIYTDGVYMGRMYANNLDMLEIERVEVLRGPQGTLFGKNTSGGAISIVTRQPDVYAFSGRAQLTAGSRDKLDVLGNVNLPLIDEHLALRIAGARLSQTGYSTRADGQEMGDTDRSSARAQLLYRPTDEFSALLSADWTQFDEKNAAYKLVDTNPTVGPLVALNTTTTQRYDDRWISPSQYFYSGTGPNSARGRLRGAALTLSYDVGWATLKSISAYRDLENHNDLDPDGSPVVIIDKFEFVDQDQFSQELQAEGKSFNDRLNWVGGVYYFHENIGNLERYNVVPAAFGNTAGFTRFMPIKNESMAAFGQGNYSITDKLRLTAGLRYTHDQKDVQSSTYALSGVQTSQNAGNGPLRFATPTRQHASDSVSPRLGLDYRWTQDVMTYVSVAQGAKNGGFNGRVGRLVDFTEFDDEEVWTYEAGLRSELAQGLVRVNATAFYSQYSDLQLQISGSTVVNGAPAPFGIVTNIPKANIRGGELELAVAPAPGWKFTGGLGLTYGKYTQLPTDAKFVAANVVHEDSKFSLMPEVSYTVGAEYSTSFFSSTSLTAQTEYAYRSSTYFNPENTRNLLQPGYGLLNARLTFEHDSSGVSVSVFGTNLTDEEYITGGFDDASNPNPGLGFSVVNVGAPRTMGVSAQVRF